jgi:hypothetical protein
MEFEILKLKFSNFKIEFSDFDSADFRDRLLQVLAQPRQAMDA